MSDLIFPTVPGFNFTGGPGYSTAIVQFGGGLELRNSNWAFARHAYTVTAVRSQADIEILSNFFHAVGGRWGEFVFDDPADFQSCAFDGTPSMLDQVLGDGDGATERFALIKTYGSGAYSRTRAIRKPVAGSILVAVNGIAAIGWSFDDATGEIVLASAPATGQVVTAGYRFRVPCRFDTDDLQRVIEDREILSVSAPILEVRV